MCCGDHDWLVQDSRIVGRHLASAIAPGRLGHGRDIKRSRLRLVLPS
jgi:hypothetical protein